MTGEHELGSRAAREEALEAREDEQRLALHADASEHEEARWIGASDAFGPEVAHPVVATDLDLAHAARVDPRAAHELDRGVAREDEETVHRAHTLERALPAGCTGRRKLGHREHLERVLDRRPVGSDAMEELDPAAGSSRTSPP
jgi:hypothetical protein